MVHFGLEVVEGVVGVGEEAGGIGEGEAHHGGWVCGRGG
jgi:hypothetical protein